MALIGSGDQVGGGKAKAMGTHVLATYQGPMSDFRAWAANQQPMVESM